VTIFTRCQPFLKSKSLLALTAVFLSGLIQTCTKRHLKPDFFFQDGGSVEVQGVGGGVQKTINFFGKQKDLKW